jgi:SPP1 family predicted phage head-tail adaptor
MPRQPSIAVLIPAGKMRHQITFLTPATTQDASGGPGADVPGASVWCSVDSVYGQNVFQGQYVSESTHLISMRYRPGITPSLRIQFGTRLFNILFIANPGERNIRLDLFCEEVL